MSTATVTSPDPALASREAVIRKRLQDELKGCLPTVTVTFDDPSPGSTNHPADCASAAEFRINDSAIRSSLVGRAERIVHQLDKLDQGTYGKCDVCAKEIEAARLEACPEAATCIAHKSVRAN